MKPEIELSDVLNKIDLNDIQYAAKYCDVDEIWITMNVVSILSNPSEVSKNKSIYKSVTGHSLYRCNTVPAINWSGCWNDVLDFVAKITKKSVPEIDSILRKYTVDDTKELSIRLRNFSTSSKKNPIYGQSAQLKTDFNGNYYIWMTDNFGKLHQVPQQCLKEYLLEFDAIHFN